VSTIEVIELRDEAVRILHRAIQHVRCADEEKALAELRTHEAAAWYDDVDALSGLGCVFKARVHQ
jgi:hypothetical protein